MNKLKQLPRLMIFAEVAQKGSFTQAANALGTTKSAVSQQISQLESDLSARLLNRTTRGVSPTALGEKLLLRCQSLQEQVELVFNDVQNAGISPSGRLSVTFPHALEANVVLPAIEQLCLEYPGIQPELVASDTSMDLVTNNLDLAIHAGELPDSTYRAMPVGTLTEIFCATPLYLNRHGTPKTPQELSEHSWIATGWQNSKMSIRDKDSGQLSNLVLNQIAQANTLPSTLEMTLRHMGIALLPDVIAIPRIKSGELVQLVGSITGPLWPIYTLHAYPGDKPIHVDRFHQLVSRFFNGLLSD